MSDDNAPKVDPSPPRFDQLLGELRQIVDRLESGSLGLEDALRAFESGVHLARQGATLLDAAEERVEVLLRDQSRPGGVRTAPLDVPTT